MIRLDTNVTSKPSKAANAATRSYAAAARDTSPFDADNVAVINSWTCQAH
jgi:hypothetical protein